MYARLRLLLFPNVLLAAVFLPPSSLGVIGFMILSAASANVSSATKCHLHIVNCITHGSSRIQETVIN